VGPRRIDLLDVVGIDERGLPVTRSLSAPSIDEEVRHAGRRALRISPQGKLDGVERLAPSLLFVLRILSKHGAFYFWSHRTRRAGRNGFVRYWLREGSRVRAFSQEKRSYVSVREESA
jgi:hypothetical protein